MCWTLFKALYMRECIRQVNLIMSASITTLCHPLLSEEKGEMPSLPSCPLLVDLREGHPPSSLCRTHQPAVRGVQGATMEPHFLQELAPSPTPTAPLPRPAKDRQGEHPHAPDWSVCKTPDHFSPPAANPLPRRPSLTLHPRLAQRPLLLVATHQEMPVGLKLFLNFIFTSVQLWGFYPWLHSRMGCNT